MKTLRALLVVGLSALYPLSSGAQVPQLINYQGRLLSGTNLVNANVGLSLRLFNVASGGTDLYEDSNTVTVADGLYSTFIGDHPTNAAFLAAMTNTTVWVEVAVNGLALTPRERIASVPFALNVRAGGIAGTIAEANLSTNIARLNGTNLLFSGRVSFATNSSVSGNFSGAFSGNGSAVSNVPLGALSANGDIAWGAFRLAASPAVGVGPVFVAAADVNGDGRVDLVSANAETNTLSVLINDGRGGFTLSSSPAVGAGPYSIAVADVNGDGRVDLISANDGIFGSGNTLSVLTNGGGGAFFSNATYTVGGGPRSVVAADVNNDGKVDLISANFGYETGNTLSVLTNNGSGGFTLSSSPVVGGGPRSLAAADVNGDGKIDLVTANYGIGASGTTLSVMTNSGSGGFTLSASPVVGLGPIFVAAADVNGDGQVDLVSANWNADTLSVLTNSGSGSFTLSSSPAASGGPRAVAAADVDGDGRVDLIHPSYFSSTVVVRTNDGSGLFFSNATYSVGGFPNHVAVADVNGDGRVDLISVNTGAATLSVLLNTPLFSGAFSGDGSRLTGITNFVNKVGDTMTGALNLPEDGLAVGVTQLVVTAGGAVGVGSASPADALHVVGASGIRARVESLDNGYAGILAKNSESEWFVGVNGAPGNSQFDIYENVPSGVSRLTISTNGHVGIGTTTPSTNLDVAGGARIRGKVQIGAGNNAGTGTRSIIVRRVETTDFTAGSVIARTPVLTLERDGTFGGIRLVNVDPANVMILTAFGVDGTGAPVGRYIALTGLPATNTVFADAAAVVSFHASFGDHFNSGDVTEVFLTRKAGDTWWVGTITSSYDQ